MFTGIIKAKGCISSLARRAGDARIGIRCNDIEWSSHATGDSIAVNGVCLTAAVLGPDGFEADVSLETLAVTTLGSLAVGDSVNLEPALALGEPLGGHLVSGHVDCIGRVSRRVADARSWRIDIDVPAEFARYCARKGSVCIDGVSLTINSVSGNTVGLNIIPHTADATTIGGYVVGTRVNVEVDQIARYLERLLEASGPELTRAFLREHGYG